MNVFVLCTGRSGSHTFAKACGHIDNYSVSHESRNLNKVRTINYPDSHIEVDNKLSYFLGRLDKKFGHDPIYVHLIRDKKDTANSFKSRYNFGIIKSL